MYACEITDISKVLLLQQNMHNFQTLAEEQGGGGLKIKLFVSILFEK